MDAFEALHRVRDRICEAHIDFLRAHEVTAGSGPGAKGHRTKNHRVHARVLRVIGEVFAEVLRESEANGVAIDPDTLQPAKSQETGTEP